MSRGQLKTAKAEAVKELFFRASGDTGHALQLISHLAQHAKVDVLDLIDNRQSTLRNQLAAHAKVMTAARKAIRANTGHRQTKEQCTAIGAVLSYCCPPLERDEAIRFLTNEFEMGRAHRSAYVGLAVDRRRAYDDFVDLHGDDPKVMVGHPCSSRAGSGTLVSKTKDATVVKVFEHGQMVVFKPGSTTVQGRKVEVDSSVTARLRPLFPSLLPDLKSMCVIPPPSLLESFLP